MLATVEPIENLRMKVCYSYDNNGNIADSCSTEIIRVKARLQVEVEASTCLCKLYGVKALS
jgi:hypothetical protein